MVLLRVCARVSLTAILGVTLLPRPAAAQTAMTPASTSSAPPASAPPASAASDTSNIGDIAPDRPGLGDGSGIVGRGVWQVETGWSFESEHQDGTVLHELALPLALFRVGVTDRFELRVGADGLLSDTSSSPGSRRTSGRSRPRGRREAETDRIRSHGIRAVGPADRLAADRKQRLHQRRLRSDRGDGLDAVAAARLLHCPAT